VHARRVAVEAVRQRPRVGVGDVERVTQRGGGARLAPRVDAGGEPRL
jgi:hypothetical protein